MNQYCSLIFGGCQALSEQSPCYSFQEVSFVKTQALRKFREKLSSGNFVYGMWVTLESPSITEMAVSLGLFDTV